MNDSFSCKEEIVACIKRLDILVISTVGRAGSMLLQTLLDGHPSIVVFPEVAQRYDYMKTFKRAKLNISTWLDIHPTFYNGFEPENTELYDSMNAFFNKNRMKFEEAFYYICDIQGGLENLDRKAFMSALAISLALIRGQEVDKIKYFVFHHHNNRKIAIDMPTILDDFPSAKVLVSIRHPIENGLSFNILDERIGTKSFRNFSRNLRGWSVKSWRNLQNVSGQLQSDFNFRLLDLNALHNDPEKMLEILSRWLEIENHQSLRCPTICGIPWLGNSADGKPIKAFEKRRAHLIYPDTIDTEKGLTTDEYLFARYLTQNTLDQTGYTDTVKLSPINLFGFLSIAMSNIEFFQSNIIAHDRDLKGFIRKFGYSELLLVVLQLIAIKIKPLKPMQHYRFDLKQSKDKKI